MFERQVAELLKRHLGAYVEGLEDALVAAAATYGVVAAGRQPGAPGVWVEGRRKLAAVGVRISAGVASHGFALNVSTDLSYFDHIVPCGIEDKVRRFPRSHPYLPVRCFACSCCAAWDVVLDARGIRHPPRCFSCDVL